MILTPVNKLSARQLLASFFVSTLVLSIVAFSASKTKALLSALMRFELTDDRRLCLGLTISFNGDWMV
jgi:hypothetical protein